MIRVFLDANILFSAAYREESSLLRLWNREDFQLVTSSYALLEAERNIALKQPSASDRLRLLVSRIEITGAQGHMNSDHGLPPKDQPIFSSALGSGCSVLLTGDITDFGHLMGQAVEGIEVLTVSMFLAKYPDAA